MSHFFWRLLLSIFFTAIERKTISIERMKPLVLTSLNVCITVCLWCVRFAQVSPTTLGNFLKSREHVILSFTRSISLTHRSTVTDQTLNCTSKQQQWLHLITNNICWLNLCVIHESVQCRELSQFRYCLSDSRLF